MLVSPDQRVRLSDQSPVTVTPELGVVFVGAAATSPAFAAAAPAVSSAAQLGFVPAPGDKSLTSLPLAFSSSVSFDAAFPGDDSWLGRTVHDYFNAGGLRAWVVRVKVDPAAPLNAYMAPNPPIVATAPPTGVQIAMQVPEAGLLVLPDLEFLCLATTLPPPPAPTVPPIPAGFRPLADFVAPAPPPLPPSPPGAAAVSPRDVLARVSAALAASRPDMLCLFALPVGADQTLSVPSMVKRADAYLHGSAPGQDLPQVQAFAPLLRDASGAIASPSGLIAGVLAATAQTDGVWRSLAGRALPLGATPLRRIDSNALAELRQSGIATLRFGPGGTALDGDILACRETSDAASAARRAAGTRRLMGWLVRSLQSFGEQLVFENVLNDGRVELILTDLFADLLQRGALNGRQVTDAVTITRRMAADTAVEFNIEVAAAIAVETIQLRFLDGTLSTTLSAAA